MSEGAIGKGNVLVTGGSHSEIPLIDALHSMGYNVITTGLNRDGLGHRKAERYIEADFSDKSAVLAIAEEFDVVGIVSGCNDFAYLSTAYACERLGFRGHDTYDTACRFHHKDSFRRTLQEEDLPCPSYVICHDASDITYARHKLRLPVVVKPTDLTGGKGVCVCRDWSVVERRYQEALDVTRRSSVVLEECVEGTNHGVSALLINSRVVFAFFDNEEYWLNPYLVSGAYSPSSLTEPQRTHIRGQIETIATGLRLCDGLFHCQCILDRDGIPFLIDPCRRAPGDLYVKLVSYATGINYPACIVRSELGLPFSRELEKASSHHNIARECVMADKNGVLECISIASSYREHIIEEFMWGQLGDVVDDYKKYKAGILFFEYQEADELRKAMSELRGNVVLRVRG